MQTRCLGGDHFAVDRLLPGAPRSDLWQVGSVSRSGRRPVGQSRHRSSTTPCSPGRTIPTPPSPAAAADLPPQGPGRRGRLSDMEHGGGSLRVDAPRESADGAASITTMPSPRAPHRPTSSPSSSSRWQWAVDGLRIMFWRAPALRRGTRPAAALNYFHFGWHYIMYGLPTRSFF